MFEEALIKANVVCEKHYYSTGVHGFGLVSPDLNENLIDVIGSFMKNNGFMQPALSIKKLNDNEDINLTAYPNPFIDYFTVRFKLPNSERNVVLTIYDSSGKVLESFSQSDIITNQVYTHTFKENQLDEGVYILKLATPKKIYTNKLLKTICLKK